MSVQYLCRQDYNCSTCISITFYYYYDTEFNIFLNGLALDEMGQRIDDLEKNIAELMTQAGVEEK